MEPGLVDRAKLLLGAATAAAALAHTARIAWAMSKASGMAAVLLRSALATALVFGFFEVLPHRPVGIS